MKFDQSERLIKISGPFGAEEVCGVSFSANEAISRLFSCRLQFLCTNLDLTGKDVIGKNITVEIRQYDYEGNIIGSRYFNGYINRLSGAEMTTEQTDEFRAYQVEIVPWLWFLTQTSNCHIFFPEQEEKTIRSIIEDVFGRKYHVNAKWSINARILGERKVEHCVQYRETDFNFVSRILEQYGVYYYFEHSDGEHEMVLCDQANYPKAKEAVVDYRKDGDFIAGEGISSWERQYEFASGKYTHTDYNFEIATEDLETKSPKISSDLPPDVESYEIYDYPGEYAVKGEGNPEARVRQEEEEVGHNVVSASSTCKTFSPGFKFKLNSHPDKKLESREVGDYLIMSVQHRANQPYDHVGSHISYSNDITCMPAEFTYRPARITPKPIVSGIQTGVVTGPPDEEIYTDKYGRVKVFFHWDRETRKIKKPEGQNCSCWIRVAQRMAGRKYGFMAIPRIGQEVVIEFLEGDPDRPLVVGSVYNSDQMPHYDPIEHKTRTYFKTNSSKGGDGFNELMFEDLDGDEMVFVHAQKNMDVRVLNTSTETIHNNRYQIIGQGKFDHRGDEPFDGGDQSELVTRDKHLKILRDQEEKLEGLYKLTVGHGEGESDKPGEVDFDFEKIWRAHVGDGGFHRTIDGNENALISGSQSTEANGDVKSKSMSHSIDVAQDFAAKAGINVAMEAGLGVHIKAGLNCVIEAGIGLTLKVGGNFITIGPAGIFIQGTMVMINSGGAAISGSGCSPKKPDGPETAQLAEPMVTPPSHDEKTGQKSN